MHVLVVSGLLLTWHGPDTTPDPSPISVELVMEDTPPDREPKLIPSVVPPLFRESGADPDLTQGRVPEAARIDATPSDASPPPVEEAKASPPPVPTASLSGLTAPSRKPSPKAAKRPAVAAGLEQPTKSRSAIGEGGGDIYLNQIRDQIERQRVYPAIAGPMQLSGTANYEVLLLRNGDVEQVRLTKTTGVGTLDNEGLGMIRRAAPFPPVPADLPGDLIRLDLVMYIGPKGQ